MKNLVRDHAEFMAVWTALQQLIDNRDDSDTPDPREVALVEGAERVRDRMQALLDRVQYLTRVEAVQ